MAEKNDVNNSTESCDLDTNNLRVDSVQLPANPSIQSKVDDQTKPSENESKKSKRSDIKSKADELEKVIENCSIFHKSLLSELASENLSYEILDGFKIQLNEGKANVVDTYEQWRSMLDGIEPDLKTRNNIDRVEADNEQLINQVLRRMNELCVKNKPAIISQNNHLPVNDHVQPQTELQPPITQQRSHTPSLSHTITSRSKSSRSGVSRASTSMRLMQLEAKANAAALKRKLTATKATQELEQRAQQLTQAIEQSKIQAELEAAEAKEQVISQAIEEEEVGSLFNPPSRPGITPPNLPGFGSTNPVSHPITHEQPQLNSSVNVQGHTESPGPQPQLSTTVPYGYSASQVHPVTPPNTNLQRTQGPNAVSPVTINSSISDQEAFADTLAKAIHTMKLKPAEPTIFYGDPLTYLHWKVAFEGLIEGSRYTPLQMLTLLQQYLGGKAKEAVESYFQIGTDEAFRDAKKKLDKRFGQPHVISEAYRSKLEQWPIISEHDGESLQRLADYLESCKTAMKKLPELQCLNDRRENVKILEKLPLSVGNRWVTRATQIEEDTLKFPSLHDFCHFLSKEASVATNSLNKALTKRVVSNKRNDNPKPNKPNSHEKKVTTFLTAENNNTTPDGDHDQTRRFKYPCLLCNIDNHTTGVCSKLSIQKHIDIEKFFMDNNLCFSCSKPGHKMSECRHPQNCTRNSCGQQHLTVFHEYHNRGSENKTSHQSQSIARQNTTNNNAKLTSQTHSHDATARNCTELSDKPAKLMSWTIPVYVSTMKNPEKEILVYALLDSGSNNTFITNDTLNKLNTETIEETVNISTLTDTDGSKSTRKRVTGLLVRGYQKQKIVALPSCISQNKIPCNREEIPNALSVQDWPHLCSLASELISEQESKVVDFGLLIGGNLPQVFMSREERVGGDHEPFARLTDLGWTLMGNASPVVNEHVLAHPIIVNLAVSEPIARSNISYRIQLQTICSNDNLESRILKLLSSDFETNQADEIKTLSIEDIQFLKTMKAQVYKDSDGYITMPLPLKNTPSMYNRSKIMAMNRFKLLQKKLANPTFSQHYHTFMHDILNKGDAELVPLSDIDKPNAWYIPHFGVYHPKKPGKIRVVFDGSAKVGGLCLNDLLLQGPDQLNSLVGILMRFRKESVGLACDIGRMFHQFRVPSNHRDYLRFLWYSDQGEIVAYRMKVHIFGATSSPACTTFGLRTLCDMSCNTNDSAKSFIKNNFYVDDGLISLPDPQSAKKLVHEAISICNEGNLRLHKFASNSPELLQSLPESERNLQDIQSLDPDDDSQPLERTLGLLWSLKSDSFQFSSELKENPNTRRGVLSSIASIYDPLGLLSPFILNGKNILQDMCRTSTSWDDPLIPDLLSQWEGWKTSLSDLSRLVIPRCYKPDKFGMIKNAEVHHFSDASTSGYGCASYLRLVDTDNQVHCTLLMGKARVAPLKSVTIPRLELQAAVTAAQTSKLITTELGLDVTETFWTDSQVVLGYLKNTAKRFHVYVTNRIQQVRDNSDPKNWFYVPTSVNPADHASRGMNVDQLIKSNWFRGPQFLWNEPVRVPLQPTSEVSSDDPEVKSLMVASHNSPQFTLYHLLHRFSSWSTAVRVVGVFLRKVHSIRKETTSIGPVQTPDSYIIRSVQQEYFTEFQCLKDGKPIPRSSKIFNLNPFLDRDSILRVGGRLKHSISLDYQEKHPIIFPKTGHFTQILLRNLHEKAAHQGRGMTLAKMRSFGYWIIGARSLVTSLIHNCVICRLLRAKPSIPQMSPLPLERSTESPPFSYCGVDCFGPFMVKDRRTELKRYGLMATCLASRAVHIELLDDMSTPAFINAIRNLIAIRGPIREIWCDQGTNFIGAIPELTEKGVLEFKLNPPGASHMGGVWERMIRTARNVLQSLMRNHGGRLDTSSLRTLMYEVMAIINSRPLSTVTEEDIPLCPNNLLTMKSDIILPPPGAFNDSDIYSRKRWRAVQHLANVFWRRWRSEYLAHLQARQKWVTGETEIKTGNIVLIRDDNVTRNQWLRGRVEECFQSKDKKVRSAKILLGNRQDGTKSNKYLVRPVSKLITLIEPKKIGPGKTTI